MADTFILQGSYSTVPLVGNPSGFPALESPINEKIQLQAKAIQQYLLTSDSPVTVDLPAMGVDEVTVLVVKVLGGKVLLTITTADGAAQDVPVDSFLVWTCSTVPITALVLTRAPATEVQVQLFMGQEAQ